MFCVFTEEPNEKSSDISGSCGCADLKRKVREQGDEIVVLKSALADALRRLRVLEERKYSTGKSTLTKVLSICIFVLY